MTEESQGIHKETKDFAIRLVVPLGFPVPVVFDKEDDEASGIRMKELRRVDERLFVYVDSIDLQGSLFPPQFVSSTSFWQQSPHRCLFS